MQESDFYIDDELRKLRRKVRLIGAMAPAEAENVRGFFEVAAEQLKVYCLNRAMEHVPRVNLYVADMRERVATIRRDGENGPRYAPPQ